MIDKDILDGLSELDEADLKRIKLLVSESQNMGHHSKIWDGTNEQGEIVSGGVYIYVLNAGSYYDTKKMIYMK